MVIRARPDRGHIRNAGVGVAGFEPAASSSRTEHATWQSRCCLTSSQVSDAGLDTVTPSDRT